MFDASSMSPGLEAPHGDPAPRPRRRPHTRPRPRHGLLHRGHGPAAGRARRRHGLPQVLGRGGPPLAPAALRPADRAGPVQLPGRARGRPAPTSRSASTDYGCQVAADQQGRGGRAGRVDPVRDPVRPDHGAGLRRREDRQPPRQAATRRRCRRRTCPGIAPPRHGPHARSTPRRSARPHAFFQDVLGFRITEQVLDGNGHQLGVWLERSPLPARHRDRQRAQRRAAPLRLLARRLGPRPQGRRHPRLQRRADRPGPDPARGHPRQHHLLLRPARHPQRGLHRRLPPGPGLPEPSPGPRTSSAAGLFYYENVVSQRFLRFHT